MLNFAIDMAREAGKLLVQRLGSAKVTTKGDINLVTEADIAAENLIIERIRSYYPQHGILAEESGEAILVGGKRSEWKWIIDPLDGTTNYAHGYPCFCVSIALERSGVLEIGVVYDPMRNEMFAAERGHGATLNDRKIRVSTVDPGMVGDTEFSDVRFRGDAEKKEAVYKGVDYLTPADVGGPFTYPLPADPEEQAKLARLDYRNMLEKVAERYHTTPATIISPISTANCSVTSARSLAGSWASARRARGCRAPDTPRPGSPACAARWSARPAPW